MISEYCGGGDLRALVSKKKRLSEAEARLYLAEILVAIEELHKNGIIHRDIKLDNILLDKDGHAKLTDFGLSKEGMFEKKLTNTMLGGGRSYQIPEVIKEDPYEKSVDLYLFGLLAYEILAGKAAFPADTVSPDLENNIMASKYFIPSDFSPDAKDLIAKLIVANPQ
jgi:serine/threonine protein kinase